MSSTPQRPAIVVNPTKVDDGNVGAVEKAFADHGLPSPRWYETTEDDPGEETTEEDTSEEITDGEASEEDESTGPDLLDDEGEPTAGVQSSVVALLSAVAGIAVIGVVVVALIRRRRGSHR